MPYQDQQTTTAHLNRRIWLPSVCLLLVAGLHFARVQLFDQTPWKGGGFGMFSTIDSRTARFVRVYLETDRGEIPVGVPELLSKHLTEFRASPERPRLEYLASELAKLRWVVPQDRWATIAGQISATDGEIGREHLHPLEIEPVTYRPQKPGELPNVKGVKGREATRYAEQGLSVRSVRVEYWKYKFDAEQNSLVADKQDEVTEIVDLFQGDV